MIQNRITEIAARAVVWLYFTLICSKLVEFLTTHGFTGVRPFMVYVALIAVAVAAAVSLLLDEAVLIRRLQPEVIAYYAVMAVLCVWLFLRASHPEATPHWIWPAANVAFSFLLLILARGIDLSATVRWAVIAALLLQLATIFADVVRPGTFSDWQARAAGLPQNSNAGGILVVALLVMLLPSADRREGDGLRVILLLAPFCIAAIFFTLSRSALAIGFIVLGLALVLAYRAMPAAQRPFVLGGVAAVALAVIAATVTWSPQFQAHGKASGHRMMAMVGMADDEPLRDRINAVLTFAREGAKAPLLGQGTGFSDVEAGKGPHNTFLRLWADNGIVGAALYVTALALLLFIAVRYRDPRLWALGLALVLNSWFSHSMLVDPQMLVLVGLCLPAGGRMEVIRPESRISSIR